MFLCLKVRFSNILETKIENAKIHQNLCLFPLGEDPRTPPTVSQSHQGPEANLETVTKQKYILVIRYLIFCWTNFFVRVILLSYGKPKIFNIKQICSNGSFTISSSILFTTRLQLFYFICRTSSVLNKDTFVQMCPGVWVSSQCTGFTWFHPLLVCWWRNHVKTSQTSHRQSLSQAPNGHSGSQPDTGDHFAKENAQLQNKHTIFAFHLT